MMAALGVPVGTFTDGCLLRHSFFLDKNRYTVSDGSTHYRRVCQYAAVLIPSQIPHWIFYRLPADAHEVPTLRAAVGLDRLNLKGYAANVSVDATNTALPTTRPSRSGSQRTKRRRLDSLGFIHPTHPPRDTCIQCHQSNRQTDDPSLQDSPITLHASCGKMTLTGS